MPVTVFELGQKPKKNKTKKKRQLSVNVLINFESKISLSNIPQQSDPLPSGLDPLFQT